MSLFRPHQRDVSPTAWESLNLLSIGTTTVEDENWATFPPTDPAPPTTTHSKTRRSPKATSAVASAPRPPSPTCSSLHRSSAGKMLATIVRHPVPHPMPSDASTFRSIHQMPSEGDDATPLASNVVEPLEAVLVRPPTASTRLMTDHNDEESAAEAEMHLLMADPRGTRNEEETDDSHSSSADDEITVSKINVSDTDLLRSESPGCLRLTEHGLRALEMQSAATTTNNSSLVSPSSMVGKRHPGARHVPPVLPRPSTGPELLPPSSDSLVSRETIFSQQQPRMNLRHSPKCDNRSIVSSTSRSRVTLETCPEDSVVAVPPLPPPLSSPPPSSSSPTKSKQRLFPFRNLSSDASSVVPLGDTDKMLAKSRRGPLVAIFGRGGGTTRGSGGGSGSENRYSSNLGRSKGSSPRRSNKSLSSASSQRYLEQMSAEEARERQKALEIRERRRIEEKRRAYLEQQRAKEMSKGDDLLDLARPSSSRTAATVQSSVLTDEDDSLLFCSAQSRSRSGGSSSNGLLQQQRSRRSTSRTREPEQEEHGIFFRNIEFLLSETCPAILPPDFSPIGSNVSSSMTTKEESATPSAGVPGAEDVPAAARASNSSDDTVLRLPPCVVCHTGERTHVATPCLHFMYCAACAQNLPSCAVCYKPAQFRQISM